MGCFFRHKWTKWEDKEDVITYSGWTTYDIEQSKRHGLFTAKYTVQERRCFNCNKMQTKRIRR